MSSVDCDVVVTRRAEYLRESLGITWEDACAAAEMEHNDMRHVREGSWTWPKVPVTTSDPF